jgi:hypothetical protein
MTKATTCPCGRPLPRLRVHLETCGQRCYDRWLVDSRFRAFGDGKGWMQAEGFAGRATRPGGSYDR